MIVHCLFEQSGTFKNEFKKLGYEAYDYDILNDYGQTDYQIDLFKQIEGGYNGETSIFDKIEKSDLILAFFPCTRFEAKIPLLFRGEASQCKTWTDMEKLKYSMKLHDELHRNYELISKMTYLCLDKGLQMVIENPYTNPHYLRTYWPIKPAIVDTNRRDNGDYMRKPTQFFFINRKPYSNLIFEPIENVELRVCDKMKSQDGKNRTVLRSEIHPQYASRFIRQFLLPEKE